MFHAGIFMEGLGVPHRSKLFRGRQGNRQIDTATFERLSMTLTADGKRQR